MSRFRIIAARREGVVLCIGDRHALQKAKAQVVA